jgi:DNA-binding transcriptional LysR family regulator
MKHSSLRHAICEMQRIVGVHLFERSNHITKIRRSDTLLLDYAKQAIALLEQGSTNAKSAASGDTHQLRIGMSDTMAFCGMTEIVARYRSLNTGIAVSLHEIPLHEQISLIREGLLDASITLDGSHRSEIHVQAIARDSVCALIPAAHPLVHTEDLSTRDLACYSLILFSTESDLAPCPDIDEFLNRIGQPPVAFRASSLGTMLTLVALGHGVGLIGSAQMIGIRRRDVVLRTICGATPRAVTYLLHSSRGVSKPLASFIELARGLSNEARPAKTT